MVAQGQAIGAGIEEFIGNLLGQAKPARGVLCIDHDEVERQLGAHVRQVINHSLSTRFADHISEKGEFHGVLMRAGYTKEKRAMLSTARFGIRLDAGRDYFCVAVKPSASFV